MSCQRLTPARNGVAAGIGDNFGVSPTSVAVSISVTNTQMETGHTAWDGQDCVEFTRFFILILGVFFHL